MDEIVIRKFSGANPRPCFHCRSRNATHEAYSENGLAKAKAGCCDNTSCQEKAKEWVLGWRGETYRRTDRDTTTEI
jgi:hypothetical protein